MDHSTWCQHERSFGGIDPAIANKKTHCSFDHIENIVFSMGMRSGSLRVGFEPPLGNRIVALRFVPVCFEDSADAAHWVRPSFTRRQKNGDAFCWLILVAHLFSGNFRQISLLQRRRFSCGTVTLSNLDGFTWI